MVGGGHFGCVAHGFVGGRGSVGNSGAMARGGGCSSVWHRDLRVVAAVLAIRGW